MSGLSYRLIRVGRSMSGMLGLDEIFAELYQAGAAPDDSVWEELVCRARKDNYIPDSSKAQFAEALLREYRSYCQVRQNAKGGQVVKRRPMWRGIPREQVPWYPSIFDDLCNGCGKCIDFCPGKVFARAESGQAIVVSPFDCQIGCNSCERICPCKAITFPSLDILETLVSRRA